MTCSWRMFNLTRTQCRFLTEPLGKIYGVIKSKLTTFVTIINQNFFLLWVKWKDEAPKRSFRHCM